MDFELATLVDEAPQGTDWAHETKWDGVRLLAILDDGEVRLVTRNEKDWAARVPQVAQALAKLPAKQAVLDGEVVVLDSKGISRFQLLQRTFLQPTQPPIYVAFDLLFLDGEDLRPLPLRERKERLRKLLPDRKATGLLRRSDFVLGAGERVFDQACKSGLEGIVSKRVDAPYVGGRGRDWCKTKCVQRQEFVIAGYTESEASARELGALVVGVHDRGGKLKPAGKVGSGFDGPLLDQLRRRLAPLEIDESPFDGAAPRIPRVHWVKPELVAEIKFTEWTADGSLRHPVFVGLRDDKPASEIVHETPVAPPANGASRAGRKGSARERPMPSGSRSAPVRGAAPRAARSGSSVRQRRSSSGEAAEAPTVLGVGITHPDRVVIPESEATKLALAEYFAEVGERMAPYAFERTLALVRCPAGAAERCFFQKHLDEEIPGIEGVNVAKPRQPKELQPMLTAVEGLVALAQRSVVELHIWGSRADDIERPDRIVFDLDPAPDLEWQRVVEGAHHVRKLLDAVGLRSWIQLTGGKGVHVIAPIVPEHDWDVVKPFTQAIANALVTAAPDRYIAKASKAARTGRVFVDYLRNGRGATAIAPFSPRVRAGAPVATPIDWAELPKLRGNSFDLFTIRRRLARQRRDPWAEYAKARQSLRASVLRDLAIAGAATR
jgi:bifunctional non-homologous end joining protein LigD